MAYQRVGGFDATLFISTTHVEGLTGVYFPDLSELSFHVAEEGLTPEQQETAIAIFRSIRLPLPEPGDIVDEDPPPPDAPPPIDDIMGITGPE